MLVRLVIGAIIFCNFIIFRIAGQGILGFGRWSVPSMRPCADDAEMPWPVRMRRHKYNRTHDAFDADADIGDDLDDSYGVLVEICREVDGGCKHFMVLSDTLPNFVDRYAETNSKVIFSLLGIDPPSFPMPKGQYTLKEYIISTADILYPAVYGEYNADVYLVRNEDGKKMACTQVSVTFEPFDDFSSFLSQFG